MPIIAPADLAMCLHPEITQELVRGDQTVIARAISSAIGEAKLYLARFDLVRLFGSETEPAVVQDEFLKMLVAELAVWKIVRLSGASGNDAVFREAYENALSTLKNIKEGALTPAGWPYAVVGDDAPVEGNAIAWSGNPKRENHY